VGEEGEGWKVGSYWGSIECWAQRRARQGAGAGARELPLDLISCLRNPPLKYHGVSGFVGRFTNLILNQEESKAMSKEELQVLSEVTTQMVLLLVTYLLDLRKSLGWWTGLYCIGLMALREDDLQRFLHTISKAPTSPCVPRKAMGKGGDFFSRRRCSSDLFTMQISKCLLAMKTSGRPKSSN
jgi:hypothetical protein